MFSIHSLPKLKFTLGCWSTVCLLNTKRWEKLVLLFFSLKYPSLRRNYCKIVKLCHLFIFPHSHSYFIKSYPFPKHPYFGQPCPHNSPNLPVLPKTLFPLKNKVSLSIQEAHLFCNRSVYIYH